MILTRDDCFSSPRRPCTRQYTRSTKRFLTITTCKFALPSAKLSCATVGSSNCDFASPHTWWRWPFSPALVRAAPTRSIRGIPSAPILELAAGPRRGNARHGPEKREGGIAMSQIRLAAMAVALGAVGFATTGLAQQAQRPQIETTKVDGTDNVYIFRNGNHQSMFIVTKDGVIATDPIAYGRPTGGQDYIAEIK